MIAIPTAMGTGMAQAGNGGESPYYPHVATWDKPPGKDADEVVWDG